MSRRTLAALAGTLTLSLAGWAVFAAPLTPPAAAAELKRFGGCEELRQWYVDAALPLVGPWGPQSQLGVLEGAAPEGTAVRAGAGADQAVGNGATGTNLQEAGVDEPDVAKTDGELVVSVAGSELVITDVTGRPQEISRVRLPDSITETELLLVGDTVVVVGTDGYHGVVAPNVRIAPPVSFGGGTTRLLTVDISDPASPRIDEHVHYGADLVSAREHDGTVRLVLSNVGPALDFVTPYEGLLPVETLRKNRAMVRGSTVEDWLPTVGSEEGARPLVDCTDVLHPERESGPGTLSVVTFQAESPRTRSTTAVATGGELVYSSTDRLYLATSSAPSIGWGWGAGPEPLTDPSPKPAPASTQVHAFALEGHETTYVASGEVPGLVRDRWSFDEHEGRLRVATALGRDTWSPRENAVVVLEERGERLVEVGRVDGMGVREQIQSVRWFGDLAVLVTFRQVDPLYTVDLSDPVDPRVLGELKIPGFSAYLHPIGRQRLLGLGQDATLRGVSLGAQAAVFDIGDLRRPERVDTAGFGAASDLVATAEPRAFTYLPDRRTALTPVQDYMSGRTRLAVLQIAPGGSLTTRTLPVRGYDPWRVRTLPLRGAEVALVVDGEVRKLTV